MPEEQVDGYAFYGTCNFAVALLRCQYQGVAGQICYAFGGIPLRQHSNMLHAICRVFNKIVEWDFQHHVECCGNKLQCRCLSHLSHATKSHATCCLLLDLWKSTYDVQQCYMPHVAKMLPQWNTALRTTFAPQGLPTSLPWAPWAGNSRMML